MSLKAALPGKAKPPMMMPIELTMPPAAIGAGILAGIAVLLGLVFGGRSARLREPGTRYTASVKAALLLMVVQLSALVAFGTPVDFIDGLAALAIVGSAALVAFIGWSLIAWGFTLNMLLVLASRVRAEGLGQWAKMYTGGKSIRELTSDRASVLTAGGFAESRNGHQLKLTRRGAIMARVVIMLRSIFGIRGMK